jgi:hypothetical protein
MQRGRKTSEKIMMENMKTFVITSDAGFMKTRVSPYNNKLQNQHQQQQQLQDQKKQQNQGVFNHNSSFENLWDDDCKA